MATDEPSMVLIDYTNHRGENSTRRVVPISIAFKQTEWHETGWILTAVDMDKQAIRDFEMSSIHSWETWYGD